MSLSGFVCFLRRSLLQLEGRIVQATGLDRQFVPALAVHGPNALPQTQDESEETTEPSFLDHVLWMAAPKKRRTIEINRTRRRSSEFMIKVKNNIEPCVECGHLKQKHILCGFCYEKIRKETARIRGQIRAMEGGPLNTPAQETVVLYDSESPGEADKNKRIVETSRKRPSWFSTH
ncbi:39S ribosomal protein L32, mitochondrial [Esox lucius]|uniref:Large ribosomal subunit protein bL32m n=1 Tax=Esox lucius TaxID=8010 RepID=C1BZQ9_ESOLU|nr:39S ribosomal protein L32, mitochondrial [Esox lucius]ACO14512.1 39S ribosomal protein L32, mitochondrial precursor [Esox lucius]